jgi:hypothetical protein
MFDHTAGKLVENHHGVTGSARTPSRVGSTRRGGWGPPRQITKRGGHMGNHSSRISVRGGRAATLVKRAVLVMALAAPMTVVGVTTAAEAKPSGCTKGLSWDNGWVFCSSGTGQFRSHTVCSPPYWFDYDSYGDWMDVSSNPSHGYCDYGDEPIRVYIELRG